MGCYCPISDMTSVKLQFITVLPGVFVINFQLSEGLLFFHSPSQFLPLNPLAQAHSYPKLVIACMQDPPFLHGLLKHLLFASAMKF